MTREVIIAGHKFIPRISKHELNLAVMNFLLSRYIYPLQKPIVISEKLKFQLDNPRTDKEVKLVLSHLQKSLNSPDEVYKDEHHFRIPINQTEENKRILTVESALNDFKANYSTLDSAVKNFFKRNSKVNMLEKLARMWVIARYDDGGEHERLSELASEMKAEGQHGFFMLDKGNPILDNCENLVNYCYLLTLLIHTDREDYSGRSFLLHHDPNDIRTLRVDRFLNQAILYFGFRAYSSEVKQSDELWTSLFHIKEILITTSKELDKIIEDSNKEKILYVANLLKVVGNEIKDDRNKLVTLVSIIELLLTHNPDHTRFNVEDSISKQFGLKTSLLVYQNGQSRDLQWLKSRLKDIYSQRSNIAHGNFKSLREYLAKEVKKSKKEDMTEDIVLENLIGDVYNFIRAIVEEYMKDRKLVDFLKDN